MERDVHQRIADLARSLHSGPQEGPLDAGRMVEYAVSEIASAKHAGVTLVTSAA